jgi:hypothetical protein
MTSHTQISFQTLRFFFHAQCERPPCLFTIHLLSIYGDHLVHVTVKKINQSNRLINLCPTMAWKLHNHCHCTHSRATSIHLPFSHVSHLNMIHLRVFPNCRFPNAALNKILFVFLYSPSALREHLHNIIDFTAITLSLIKSIQAEPVQTKILYFKEGSFYMYALVP